MSSINQGWPAALALLCCCASHGMLRADDGPTAQDAMLAPLHLSCRQTGGVMCIEVHVVKMAGQVLIVSGPFCKVARYRSEAFWSH